jgi:hypothetical protein
MGTGRMDQTQRRLSVPANSEYRKTFKKCRIPIEVHLLRCTALGQSPQAAPRVGGPGAFLTVAGPFLRTAQSRSVALVIPLPATSTMRPRRENSVTCRMI